MRLICTLLFDGQYSLLYSDEYHQYYPFFLEFRRALRSGDSLLYSWNVGMGMDYLGLISYYLASPLYLFSVLIPDSWTLGYFSLLMPLKLGLAGLFFAIFLKKIFRKDDISIVLFGSFYALCAWALGYQWNIMWLDTFALLPLVTLGAISLLKERKFILYTITLFLSVFSNYYIGFFTCIFVFLLFICYEISYWKSFSRFLTDILVIAAFSILAIGMTAILELPALAALQRTQSSVNTFPTEFSLNIVDENNWKGLLNAMRQVAGNMNGGLEPTFKEGLPNLYCGVLTNLLAFLFLTDRRSRIRERVCCAMLLLLFNVSFVIRQLDYIWHGFHFTNMIPYRFSFLYSFVLLYMAYKAWVHRNRFRIWQVITAGMLSITILLFCQKLPEFLDLLTGKTPLVAIHDFGDLMRNMEIIADSCAFLIFTGVFLLLYGTVLLCCYRWKKQPEHASLRKKSGFLRNLNRRRALGTRLMCIFMAVELFLNLVIFAIYFPIVDISNYPSRKNDTAKAIAVMKALEKDTLFYRAETTHAQTLNDGALNNYNGISTFTSSANVNVTRYMKALGYGARDTYNRYCYEEASPVSNLFLNVKYMIERDGSTKDHLYFTDVYQSGYVHLLENDTYLPLGFMVENQILNVDFASHRNPFDVQNELMRNATTYSNLHMTAENAQITSKLAYGYCSYAADPVNYGTVTYSYTADTQGLMCINLVLQNRNSFSVKLNGQLLYNETYSISQMLAVSNVVPGDVVEVIMNTKPGEAGFIEITSAILDDALYRQCYEKLSASTLELTKFTNTAVEGTIHCDHSGLLYTSIPQDGNWIAYIDGKPAQIVAVADAMCALQLSEGQHTIAFH